jgi:diguanylate cyclase (GGDEF)-like protein
MATQNISNYLHVALIVAEVILISLFAYAVEIYHPVEMVRYISLDVLYCLPILQAARLTAIHSSRRYDTQAANIAGITVALVWSVTEVIITWPHFPIAAFLLNTFTRSVAFTVIGRVMIKLWREREYAHKDSLTGVANRLELMERIGIEQRRSERSGRPYSLLFIDIDAFKSLNDIYGHQVGDDALKVLANTLTECSRKVDVAARLGGDEFVLLLPDTDEQSCDILIDRIKTSTELAFGQRGWPISVSIGKTTHVGKSQEMESVIQLADENMYEIKRKKQQWMKTANGNSTVLAERA